MKVIIAGSRNCHDKTLLLEAISAFGEEITEVVSGCASGVDEMGEDWAAYNDVHVTKFPADWDVYGRSAGPRRNSAMARYADGLIAVWDGKSKGTKNMIDTAVAHGLNVIVSKIP